MEKEGQVGLDAAVAVARQRIEFRAGLAIAAAATVVLLAPAWAWGSAHQEIDGLLWAVLVVPILAAVVGTFALTGSWIDAIRTWWGPHAWVHPRSSTRGWLYPLVNLYTPQAEMSALFERAGRPDWWRAVWSIAWVVLVINGLFPKHHSQLTSSLLPLTLLGALVLWLVVSSMRSLRREWQRQDDVAEATGNPAVG